MRPSKAITLLQSAFKARQRVLIKGIPGVGKSEIVNQVCDAIQWDLLISHPAVSDPTDYKGMPAVIDGGKRATFLPFGDLEALINAARPTVCFVDDIGQAPPAVQAALMQPLQARRINGHKVSDHVVFCGATNDTHMAGVAGLIEPVKSRWDTIIELEVSVDDWCAWALRNKMPPILVAFIRFRPALLSAFKPTRELKNSPCPRTVSAVGRWLNAGVNDFEVIAGAVGEGWATEFVPFQKLFAECPSLDAIIMDPVNSPLPTSAGATYAVSAGLAHKATPANFERILRYMGRLDKEFEVCCVRDAAGRDKALTHSPAYTAWVTHNADVLA